MVNIRYDSRAVLMKYAHESSFINSNWIPVTRTFKVQETTHSAAVQHYSTDGLKSIFVKFADLNGLESSVYELKFYIETESPSLSSMFLLQDWPNIAASAYDNVPVNIVATDAGTGIKELMLCNNSNFSGCSWEPFVVSRSNWTLSGSSHGSYTVYAKVRDFLDRESAVVSDSITVTEYTVLFTQDGPLSLHKDQGPYTFTSSVVIAKDLTIGAGTNIYYPSSETIKVLGKLRVQGTSSDRVKLVPTNNSNTFGGFILNEGLGGPHEVAYLDFGTSAARQKVMTFFKFNGMVAANVRAYTSSFGVMFEKEGVQHFELSSSLFNHVTSGGSSGSIVKILAGTSNVVKNNNVSVTDSDTMGMSSASVFQTYGSNLNATFEYNTVYLSMAPNNAQNNIFLLDEGTYMVRNNDIQLALGGSSNNPSKIFYPSGYQKTHNISVEKNNLEVQNAAARFHFYSPGAGYSANWTITDNYFGASSYDNCSDGASSCSDNPAQKYCTKDYVLNIDCITSPHVSCSSASPSPTNCVGSSF